MSGLKTFFAGSSAALLLFSAASADVIGAGAGNSQAIMAPITIVPATGTTAQPFYTATGSGAVFTGIFCNTPGATTTTALQVSEKIAGTAYPLFTVNVVINATGQGTSPAVNLLNANSVNSVAPINTLPNDDRGNPYFELAQGATLQINATTAMSAGAANCTAQGVQY